MKIVGNERERTWKVLFKSLLLVSIAVCFVLNELLSPVECHAINILDNLKFMNENATLFHPLTIPAIHHKNTFRNLSLFTEEQLTDLPWWCSCSAELEEVEVCAA